MSEPRDLSRVRVQAASGDRREAAELLPPVDEELRNLARRVGSETRGGGRRRTRSSEIDVASEPAPPEDLLALDEDLAKLEATDPRHAKIVLLRFFCGRSAEDTARALVASTRASEREWRVARAILRRAIAGRAAAETTDGERSDRTDAQT
ncbi:MAG TPA: ECF-type sigma factor [Planctomycetota bacterium]|nr:ECF-type sigma factor [Planctomycetota bacterium]